MDRFEGYYLYSDLDCTLLAGDKGIPENNIAALRRFIDGGGRFGIATGRTPHNLNMGLDMSLVNAPSILCNGVAVYDVLKREYMYHECLDKAEAKRMALRVMAFREDASVQVSTMRHIYQVNPNPDIWEDPLVEKEGIPILRAAMEDIGEPWLKMVFPARPETVIELHAALEREGFDSFTLIRSGAVYLEILPKGATKGSALRRIRGMLPAGSVMMAIGDYYNDLDMLMCADISAAPANAPEDIRQKAMYSVCHNDDGAVADFLERALFCRQV